MTQKHDFKAALEVAGFERIDHLSKLASSPIIRPDLGNEFIGIMPRNAAEYIKNTLYKHLASQGYLNAPRITKETGRKRSDLTDPYRVRGGKWRVNEQLYPEARGYNTHEFETRQEAEAFLQEHEDD